MAVEELVDSQSDEELLRSDDIEIEDDKTDKDTDKDKDKVVVIKPDEDKEDKEDEEEEEDKEDPDKKVSADEKEIKDFPFERPSIAEIKAEFPDFFKKFPVFRDVVFQEIEYRKLFPTVEDAKEAIDDNLAFNGLQDSVLSGNADTLLEAIERVDKTAAAKFASNFLPTLYKKNQDLYVQAITPLFETLIRNLGKTGNENNYNAALVIAEYLWPGHSEGIVKGEKTFVKTTEESAEVKQLQAERKADSDAKFSDFQKSCATDMISGMTGLISKGIDPDGTMSEYAKKTLIADIINQVDKQLVADSSHMQVMNSRWMRCKKEGLNLASKEKIVSAYLSRAKQVIPSIRDKARNDFLGVKKKTSERKLEEIDNKSSKTKEVPSGRIDRAKNLSNTKPSRELYRTMSDLDILNS